MNNALVVIMSLFYGEMDPDQSMCFSVMAGLDTDCNGATVGALWGLTGKPIPRQWTEPWNGLVVVMLAGVGDLKLDDLIDRTVAVANQL